MTSHIILLSPSLLPGENEIASRNTRQRASSAWPSLDSGSLLFVLFLSN